MDVDKIKEEDRELEALRARAMRLEAGNGRLRTLADQIAFAIGMNQPFSEEHKENPISFGKTIENERKSIESRKKETNIANSVQTESPSRLSSHPLPISHGGTAERTKDLISRLDFLENANADSVDLAKKLESWVEDHAPAKKKDHEKVAEKVSQIDEMLSLDLPKQLSGLQEKLEMASKAIKALEEAQRNFSEQSEDQLEAEKNLIRVELSRGRTEAERRIGDQEERLGIIEHTLSTLKSEKADKDQLKPFVEDCVMQQLAIEETTWPIESEKARIMDLIEGKLREEMANKDYSEKIRELEMAISGLKFEKIDKNQLKDQIEDQLNFLLRVEEKKWPLESEKAVICEMVEGIVRTEIENKDPAERLAVMEKKLEIFSNQKADKVAIRPEVLECIEMQFRLEESKWPLEHEKAIIFEMVEGIVMNELGNLNQNQEKIKELEHLLGKIRSEKADKTQIKPLIMECIEKQFKVEELNWPTESEKAKICELIEGMMRGPLENVTHEEKFKEIDEAINTIRKEKPDKAALRPLVRDLVVNQLKLEETKWPVESEKAFICEFVEGIIKNELVNFEAGQDEKLQQLERTLSSGEEGDTPLSMMKLRPMVVEMITQQLRIEEKKWPTPTEKSKICEMIEDIVRNAGTVSSVAEETSLPVKEEHVSENININNSSLNQPGEESANQPQQVNLDDPGLEEKIREVVGPILDDMEKEFTQENDKLWDYVQEFVNEQACSRIKALKSLEFTAREKHDSLEWMARNIEFVSPSLLKEAIDITRNTITGVDTSNIAKRNRTIFLERHNSDVMISLMTLLKESETTDNDALLNLVSGYLKLIDVLILSDFNLEQAVANGLLEHLLRLKESKRMQAEDQKSAFKLIGHTMREEKAFEQVQSNSTLLKECIAIIQRSEFQEDTEMVLGATQIIQAFLETSDGRITALSSYSGLGFKLVKNCAFFQTNEKIFYMTVEAMVNLYVLDEDFEPLIGSEQVTELLKIYQETPSEM